jgi:hypothetical protein
MPKTEEAPTKATKPKAHREVATTSKKSAGVVSESAPVPEFDAEAHRQEIAQIAYRLWLERADGPGSPEEDWLKAVSEVRAKYTR